MSERKYTLSEIDGMRQSIYAVNDFFDSTNFKEFKRRKIVEDQLRTYMLNGTDPEELRRAANQKLREHI